ncbi:UMP kinase [Mycoplasma bradburyae]|uniref:UMP kinase n=1 Tax=Mycoplasma bradburyae TaxID=2963128 RepID=UPI0020CD4C55|nr:UMP kinase [Mycoplasma bradburyae]UTS70940.1 UMP kinase [Mycoplasma bradburyae]
MKKPNIIIKISGASLQDKNSSDCYSYDKINSLANQLKTLSSKYNIGLIVGGGNIFRGKLAKDFGVEINKADYIGMLATVINSSLLESKLQSLGLKTKVLSALEVKGLTKEINPKSLSEIFNDCEIAFFSGGTGNSHFTTDTATVLRAIQINADMVLIGKDGVDGVYTADPKIDKNATFIEKISYKDALAKELRIMDLTAFSLAMDHNLKLLIFNIEADQSIIKTIDNKNKHTTITN